MDAIATSPKVDRHREHLPGQWLGRVLLVQKVATGGMGEVWEGRQQPLERRVAVKFLRREFADDPTIRARFVGEARALASVDHRGVVAVHDVHDEPPAIVMSYIEGVSLRTWIAQSDMPPWEGVRGLLLQVSEALESVHRAGIVHRDLKPDNVMVSRQADGDQITIIDFGIARHCDGPRLTGTSLLGTPEYMSPEQWRGEVADARTDVYALGCLAFELLTGDPPFIGPSTTLLRREHQEDAPDPPTLIRTDLCRVHGVDEIVARCLAKAPEDRFGSMSAVADALRATGTVRRPDSGLIPGVPRRNRLAVAALVLSSVAAIVATSAAWAALRGRDDATRPQPVPSSRVEPSSASVPGAANPPAPPIEATDPEPVTTTETGPGSQPAQHRSGQATPTYRSAKQDPETTSDEPGVVREPRRRSAKPSTDVQRPAGGLLSGLREPPLPVGPG